MSKSNSFLKYLKNINKSIHSLLEKNLNRLKYDNLIGIAKSNKIFLAFFILIICFLSYLSIPNIYKQSEIVEKLNKKLNEKFEIEFNFKKKIQYRIFPKPHFVSSETSIFDKNEKIAEIKIFKIYLSLKNLFSVNNLKIKEVSIDNANFNLKKSNHNFFINILENDFKDMKLKISNGKVFYRSLQDEVLFINNIYKMNYFYDKKELKNIFYSENELFNIPYSIKFFNDQENKKFFSKINIDKLRFEIENYFDYSGNFDSGVLYFVHNNLNSIADYKFEKNYFKLNLYERDKNPKFLYNAEFNFKPFYSSLEGTTEELNLSYLFNPSALLAELIKTNIFNNKNLNFQLNVNAKKILKFNSFQNLNLNSKIDEGLIDIDDTNFGWKENVKFKLFDTLIHVKNGELFLDGSSRINLIDYNEVYKFLVTPKNYRKKINQVDLNFVYNFDQKILNLKDIRIDGKINEKVNKILTNLNIKDDDLQNKIYLKKLLNEAAKYYAG